MATVKNERLSDQHPEQENECSDKIEEPEGITKIFKAKALV